MIEFILTELVLWRNQGDSELLPQIADDKYPGPGGALVSLCWSPFAVEKNVIVIAAPDTAGLKARADELVKLLK